MIRIEGVQRPCLIFTQTRRCGLGSEFRLGRGGSAGLGAGGGAVAVVVVFERTSGGEARAAAEAVEGFGGIGAGAEGAVGWGG